MTFCLGMNSSGFWEGATLLISHSLGAVNALIYGYQRRLHKNVGQNPSVHVEFKEEREDSLKWENVQQRFDDPNEAVL